MTIAVYARNTKDNHPLYIEKLIALLKKEKVNLIVFEPYYEFLKREYHFNVILKTFTSYETLKSKADYVLCLGGDGTILETVALVRKSGIPVLGVNTGRLGFLASVSKDDIEKAVALFNQRKIYIR